MYSCWCAHTASQPTNQPTWMRKFIVPLHCGRCIVHLHSVIFCFVFVIARFPVIFVVAHTRTNTHKYSLAATLLDITLGRTHTHTPHLLQYIFTQLYCVCTFHSAFLVALNSRISNICASVVDIRPIIYQMSLRYLVSNSWIRLHLRGYEHKTPVQQHIYTPTISTYIWMHVHCTFSILHIIFLARSP